MEETTNWMIALFYWSGVLITISGKIGHSLWTSYRDHERALEQGLRSSWVLWKSMLDWFFETRETTTTTQLTLGFSAVIFAIWMGTLDNWLGINLDVIPKHEGVAFVLGALCEGVAAPISKRVSHTIVGS